MYIEQNLGVSLSQEKILDRIYCIKIIHDHLPSQVFDHVKIVMFSKNVYFLIF